MSRPPRGDRLTAAGQSASRARPKRRAAAKANIFKYQLATDPSRVEENDLKRALQRSLEDVASSSSKSAPIMTNGRNKVTPIVKRARWAGADSRHASSSPEVTIVDTIPATTPIGKRTRFSAPSTVVISNGHSNNKNKQCDVNNTNPLITLNSATTSTAANNRTIRTYSRHSSSAALVVEDIDSRPNNNSNKESQQAPHNCLNSSSSSETTANVAKKSKSSAPDSKTINIIANGHDKPYPSKSTNSSQSSVSRSTQTPTCKLPVAVNNNTKTNVTDASSPGCNHSGMAAKNFPPTKDNDGNSVNVVVSPPVQDQYLKSKRESKNYAYVKMTALKVSTEKFPSSHARNSTVKHTSPKGILNNSTTNKDSLKATQQKARDNSNGNIHNSINSVSNSSTKKNDETKKLREENSSRKHDTASTNHHHKIALQRGLSTQAATASDNQHGRGSKNTNIPSNNVNLDESGIEYDCSPNGNNSDLSNDRDPSHTNVNAIQKRNPEGSWSLLGVPEEKTLYIRDDEPPRRLICYPAIKHVEGDVIQVRDSVLLRSGARKTDLPYIAKVCAFWEDAETGGVMMSLFWYYRPEHTEDGRKLHHLMDEIFASRHRDVDSVECIEDKCYVLTFNEYCRYRKRCKMEQVNTNWSLTDVTIPMSNESYPRRNRIPDSDVNPELVFCCRQVYDSRLKRLLKNPLINPKYGHI